MEIENGVSLYLHFKSNVFLLQPAWLPPLPSVDVTLVDILIMTPVVVVNFILHRVSDYPFPIIHVTKPG